jgi:hypothetical protein
MHLMSNPDLCMFQFLTFSSLTRGERRYIIAHPSQCKNMALYPRGHPSLRHSSIDWSNPTEWDNDPNFRHAQVNEVIMHAGDVLYV